MDSGEILIIGGQVTGGAIASTEVYNLETDSWYESTDLPTPISGAGLARGTNGNLFLIGGENRLTVLEFAFFLVRQC